MGYKKNVYKFAGIAALVGLIGYNSYNDFNSSINASEANMLPSFSIQYSIYKDLPIEEIEFSKIENHVENYADDYTNNRIENLEDEALELAVEEVEKEELNNSALMDEHIEELYRDCRLKEGKLPFATFRNGMLGYYNLLKSSKLRNTRLLSIVDYDQSSTSKRMYIIDLKKRSLAHQIFVAHGKKSGVNYATEFSNIPESHQSSLGFYKTAETYEGKYGYSLRLDGFEKEINCEARDRAIVMHSADYVSKEFMKKHGRLGRSWGCLTITEEDNQAVIDLIRNGSCIYVHKNQKEYQKKSKLLNEQKAVDYFASVVGNNETITYR